MAYTYGNYGYAKDSNGTTIAYNGTNVYQIRLGYQVNSQDIENNTSNVSLQLEVRSINASYRTYGYNQTTTIDGTTYSAKTFDFRSTNTWQVFGTKTFDVSHNADGTYDVNKSGSFTTTATGTGRPHSGSASVQMTLPTIPRASTITVNDANIGSSTNIVINKASASFTTTLSYKASGQNSWTTIVSKTSNQVYGWTVPTSFYALIPNSKTISCEFKAETFSGDTSVGEKTTTAIFTATGNPTINSASATDTNSTTVALTGDSAKMVKYASNVQISVSASGQNSATISSITVNGNNVSGGSITFNGATTNSFEIKVIDSRGYTTTTTKTMTMVNYVPLSISATIRRNQPTDEKVNINFSGNYFNGSFGSQSNTLTVQYRYKESTASDFGNWTSLTATASGNTYSGSTQLSNMDYTKSYNFEIRATDKVGTKPITGITVTKGEPVYWWDNDEFNVNGKLGVNGNATISGDIQTSGLTSYGGMELYHATPYIDFHYNNSTSDYTSRIIEDASGRLKVSGNFNVGGELNSGNLTFTPLYASSLNTNDVGTTYPYSQEIALHNTGNIQNAPSNNEVAILKTYSWGGNGDWCIQEWYGLSGSGLSKYIRQHTPGSWGGWVKTSEPITSGSNANGSWVKFEDGTMICSKKVSGTININSSWGNGYTSGDINLGSWPQTFTATPEIQITPQRGSGGMNFWPGAQQSVSTTSAGTVVILRFTSATNVNYILHVTGYGRWK